MKTIYRTQRISSRAARDRGDAPPLLTHAEQLNPVKLELLREVEADGVKIKEIVINVPTVDDILDQQMDTQEASKEITLRMLAKSCKGVPPETLRAMHPRDFRYLSEIYWAFQE